MLNIGFNGSEYTMLRLGLPCEESIFDYENLDWGRIHPNDFDNAREELVYKSNAPINQNFKLANLAGYALQCPRCLNPSFVEDRIEAMIVQDRITLVKRSDDPEFKGSTILRVEHSLTG